MVVSGIAAALALAWVQDARAFKVVAAENAAAAVGLAAGETWGAETLAAGMDVAVAGTVEKDAWLFASQGVEWTGEGRQDVRAFGRSVALRGGRVEGNAALFGQDAVVAAGAEVGGDLLAVAAVEAACEGHVAGKGRVWGTSVVLGGRWDGDVSVKGTKLRLKPGTVVKGTLFADVDEPFVAGNDVEIGEIKRAERPQPTAAEVLSARAKGAGKFFLGALVAGAFFFALFPLRAVGGAAAMRQAPFKSFLLGLAFVLGAVWLSAMLVGLGVGAMGVPMAAGALLLFGGAALPVAGLWIGGMILRRGTAQGQTRADMMKALAAGTAVLAVLTLLPGSWGWPVLAALWTMAVGGLMMSPFGAMVEVRVRPRRGRGNGAGGGMGNGGNAPGDGNNAPGDGDGGGAA